jgi:hypothetical protein
LESGWHSLENFGHSTRDLVSADVVIAMLPSHLSTLGISLPISLDLKSITSNGAQVP